MRIKARRFDTRQPSTLELAGDLVAEAIAAHADFEQDLPWVAPGFVDVQVNGYGGQEFSSLELTPEKVAHIVRQHLAFGVVRLCPTLTTQSFDVLAHGLRQIAAACDRWPDVERMVPGVHVEGPYISAEEGPRGAHPAEHCRPPDIEEFRRLQEAAAGRIAILTLSPEYEGAARFISQVTASGVIVSIAHTAASGDQIRAAVDAGARFSTHLGNGAHRLLRRHPNYLWDQLAEDRLLASLIVDGHHLPREVVQTFVRAKTPARCLLVSDVSGLAGLPVGRHPSMGGDVEILADGRLVIAGQTQLLAGASLPITHGVVNVMRFAGIDLAAAVEMASLRPASLLGLPPATLRPGDPADLVLFDLPADWEQNHLPLHVRATILGGRVAFGHVPPADALLG